MPKHSSKKQSSIIQVDNVTKCYNATSEVLSHVSFSIETGEMAFLTGHSGAGKSTLLKLLTLIERPSQGNVYIAGKCLNKCRDRFKARLRRNIGVILQNPYLLDEHTVFENIALPLIIAGFYKKEAERRVRAALDKVGLLSKEKLYPAELSGGEQQRVSIARAIVNKPKILLADEPTGNLDPGLSTDIIKLFEAFNQVGVTVLIASHDLALIGGLQYRILTLHQGRLVGKGVNVTDAA